MESKSKVGIGVVLTIAIIGGAMYFSSGDTFKGSLIPLKVAAPTDLCPNIAGTQAALPEGYNYNGKNCESLQSAPALVDLCLDIEGMQQTVPLGFISNENHRCSVNSEVAGVLTVERDPSWTSRSIAPGSTNAVFTKLKFSTSGSLPIKVMNLSLIATTGNTNIDYIRLFDRDRGTFITDTIRFDALGKAHVQNFAGLFMVAPGQVKHIDIFGTVKANAVANSQIALGIYSETSVNDQFIDLYASAGNTSGPEITYTDLTAQFADGSTQNPYLIRVLFKDSIRYNATFHVIAGNTMTVNSPR